MYLPKGMAVYKPYAMSSILFVGPVGFESYNKSTQNKPIQPLHPLLHSESIKIFDKK